ncbi:hypothetical protein HUG10_05120 [Halorarum halophilum]|uniref:Uncharacterized protein n=1 Tax=Halorarum halophilum TaxID=2743090 RepID=A0A7D5KWN4_9EURY|nr:hypothetical protein [Halobaculum halophilum]QLG26958.1 hypothetical protein HUG10_05120 [Halobaculum halophilum]
MNRRALLAAVAAFGGALGAGCAESTGRSPTSSTASPTREPTPTPTDVTSTNDTATDYPEVGGTPSEVDCPPFDDHVRRVVCWTDGRPDDPLFVRPSKTSGTLPRATFEFTLVNGTDLRFGYNRFHWQVWKRVAGEWYYVAPRSWVDPLFFVEPGESWTLTVAVDAEGSVADDADEARGGSAESVALSGFGGGEYAFAVDGWFEGQDYRDGTGLAARFALEGEELELTPDDTVTDTERDGDAVTVRTDVDGGDDARECAFVLERADAPDPRRYVAEQAIRDRRLRNTLPFFEDGVERVELVEQNGVTPPFGVNEPYGISYDGESYRVSAEEREPRATGG